MIAADINLSALEELSGHDGIEIRPLDVLSPDAIAKTVAEIGAVDILFNCAGVVHNGTILQASEADLEFALDLNLKAQIRMIKAVLPGMLERKDGAISRPDSQQDEKLKPMCIGAKGGGIFPARWKKLSQAIRISGGRHSSTSVWPFSTNTEQKA